MTSMIKVERVTKIFKSGRELVRAVDAVDLELMEREFLVLLGLSGSGKTTLLRCVGGLEKPEGGEIVLAGRVVSSSERGTFLPPEDRAVGMVFQSYAVWPHMTVFGNVAFPLMHGKRKLPQSKVREKVMAALELVQLAGLENRPAPFLSGGQQQRVALARALAVEPKILLMDEPLSNLDARLREEVREEIRSLATKLGITVLYVTHDQVEAIALADRIGVMSQGKILQIGSPQELYDVPGTRAVGGFLGFMNEFAGTIESDNRIKSEVGLLVCSVRCTEMKEVIVGIRPEDIEVSHNRTGRENEFPSQLVSKLFLGDTTVCHFSVNGQLFRYKSTRVGPDLQPRSETFIRFPMEKLKVFAR